VLVGRLDPSADRSYVRMFLIVDEGVRRFLPVLLHPLTHSMHLCIRVSNATPLSATLLQHHVLFISYYYRTTVLIALGPFGQGMRYRGNTVVDHIGGIF
jgi:hypothetical protein